MFWVIFFGVLLVPLFVLGFIVDKKRKTRINTNNEQFKPSNSDTDERKHFSMGENIRGGGE